MGNVVPDLPGCYSASDNGFDGALKCANEAIEAWLETALELGQEIPLPSSIIELQNKPEFKGWIWAVVDFDITTFIKTKRRNG